MLLQMLFLVGFMKPSPIFLPFRPFRIIHVPLVGPIEAFGIKLHRQKKTQLLLLKFLDTNLVPNCHTIAELVTIWPVEKQHQLLPLQKH